MSRPASALTTFIRSLPADLPVKEVIAKAKAAGHETSAKSVSRVRLMAGSEVGASKPAPKALGQKASPKKATTPAPTFAAGTISKSDFVRSVPASLSPIEVVAAAKRAGIELTTNLVYTVRGRETPQKAATERAPSKPPLAPSKKAASKPMASIPTKAAPKAIPTAKATPARRKPSAPKRPATSPRSEGAIVKVPPQPLAPRSSVEDLLRAAAAELGLGRAIEVLEGERARIPSGSRRVTRMWVRDPHSGGVKIPETVKATTKRRILAHAEKHYAGRYARLDVRFKGALCYIDAYTEPSPDGTAWKITGETREQYLERLRSTPLHLCRLRHFGPDRWSVAFYTYSHERYEPTFFASGEDTGTPEEGLDIGAVYLTE